MAKLNNIFAIASDMLDKKCPKITSIVHNEMPIILLPS